MILKIYFDKAYDLVSLEYLLQIMSFKGYGQNGYNGLNLV